MKEKKTFVSQEKKPFSNAAVGGTFDHLHKGHKKILKTAFAIADYVFIGLTTFKMIKKKQISKEIEPYEERKKNIVEYLTKLQISSQFYDITPLNDGYGPTISNAKFEALVCSTETYPTALKINEIRRTNGFHPLVYIVIPMVIDKKGDRYSSTKIREKIQKKTSLI